MTSGVLSRVHRGADAPGDRAGLIEGLDAMAFTVPTDAPESDGTIEWSETTMVLVQARAAGVTGMGYTYAPRAAVGVVLDVLGGVVRGRDAMDIPRCWADMLAAVRNAGRRGLCAMSISAVDSALWDLKARLLGVSLLDLLGAERDEAPVYGSGGFTSYSTKRLAEQLAGWAERGIPRVKMKIGRRPADDPDRVSVARKAIGERAQLFVDANGAYSVKQALAMANRLGGDYAVRWFEEPVSSDDLQGLRMIRERAPAGMDVAAGEYLWDPWDCASMLAAGAVDCLQIDATRCCGITGFLRAAAIADGVQIPVSAHCAPQLHAHAACAAPRLRHIEYFHDHVRIERMLFDGVLEPEEGCLRPDRSRAGTGLSLKEADAQAYRVA